MKRLDEIRAREQAATEGPWLIDDLREPNKVDGFAFPKLRETVQKEIDANAEFIAHAREDIPRLLAAVDAVLELHDRVGDFECSCGGAWPCPTARAITEAVGE